MSPRIITPEEIASWATSTFGTQSLRTMGLKLHEEVLELLVSLDQHTHARTETAMRAAQDNVGEELADVFIVLVQLTSRIFGPHERFLEAVTDKMQVNTQRQWAIDSEGRGQHIEKDNEQ